MTQPPAQTHPKRRRDAAATRSAIFEAATRRFADQGYQCAGVREIAADAGVDAAMVNRYFGSKEGLFTEVIDRAFNRDDLLAGERVDLAARLARYAVFGSEDVQDTRRIPLLLLLRSAAEPRAAALLRASLDRNFVQPLAKKLGGADAEARAALVTAHLNGFATLDRIIGTEAFARIDRERLVVLLTSSLGTYFG
jgi:AcrR family transcriptional regulator